MSYGDIVNKLMDGLDYVIEKFTYGVWDVYVWWQEKYNGWD